MIITLKIKSIKKLNSPVKVYDLSVDKTHNFFVGNSQILTSNCDGITINGQQALRNVMETYSSFTRFILTANFKHKIITPLQSRCQLINLKPNIEAAVKRCCYILKNEGVEVLEDQKKKFIDLIKEYFPDLRRCINELQKNVFEGKLQIKHLGIDNKFISSIFNFISNKDVLKCREFYIENESQFQGDYQAFLKHLLEYVYELTMDDMKKKEMIAIIANHLYQGVFVADAEINAFACLINLEKAIK